jgi:pimeloyl-ACP methyl ester carboxylesterase
VKLTRPDGVEIHWQESGAGPTVLLSHHWYAHPRVLENLLTDLARDHRVATYDPRGTGDSSRRGPYDAETDTADLEAVLEALGGEATIIGWGGDGTIRAVRAAAAHRDLCGSVVSIGGTPLGQEAMAGTDSPAASGAVQEALGTALRNDYRSALRAVIRATSLQMDEQQMKERVEMQFTYCDHEAALGRFELWRSGDLSEEARELGERLWVLLFETSMGAPDQFAARTREVVPRAHVYVEAEGPVSRPDLTAAVVRGVTSPLREGSAGRK